MDYNYHTHTVRCHHATGSEEEYIIRAIENGIKHMGFSDHIPFIFPDGYESPYRVPMAELEAYVKTITGLRDKYKNDIEIVIGFETEYYPTHFAQMVDNVRKVGAEYLILGQHFIGEEHPDGQHSSMKTDDESQLAEYCDCLIGGIESGVISYIAHPDLFRFIGDGSIYRREVRRICEASKRNGIPLEINFLGIRDNRFYPHEEFWKVVSDVGSPVTFGFDAHDVTAAYDSASLEKAKAMVKRLGLNYIGKANIRSISIK